MQPRVHVERMLIAADLVRSNQSWSSRRTTMSIPEKDIKKLWGLAAGRCSCPGCEQELGLNRSNGEWNVVDHSNIEHIKR